MSFLGQKDLLPTNMSSAELRTLSKDVRQRSLFSAKTMLEDLLASYQDKISRILNPETAFGGVTGPHITPVTTGLDLPLARLQTKQLLDSIGYHPEEGKAGTIEDLSSDARINLVLKTNVQLAQGWGQNRQGQDEAVLDEYPAQELYRLEEREKKRDWLQRFREAGDATGRRIGDGWTITPDGRMVALKNHPIWDELGSSENFDDALDVDYPPFAFNSGMWVEDIDRDEAVSLGIMGADDQVAPDLQPFTLDV
jgi:hypothetical protein